MMLMPRRDFDLFDNFFRDEDFFTKKQNSLMKTDVKEKKDKYEIKIDMPGFEKKDIKLSLKKGYLEISAKTSKEDNEEEEKYVRRERFFGECSRSFYVGEDITEEEIDAEFKNGILKIDVPKKEKEEDQKETKQIEIK